MTGINLAITVACILIFGNLVREKVRPVALNRAPALPRNLTIVEGD